MFLLFEDEFGTINLIVAKAVYERHRQLARAEPLLLARGRLERSQGVINVIVRELAALEHHLPDGLEGDGRRRPAHGASPARHRARRAGRPDPARGGQRGGERAGRRGRLEHARRGPADPELRDGQKALACAFVELVELDEITSRQWSELAAGEREPWGGAAEELTWADKQRHLGLRAGDGALVAIAGAAIADIEVEGAGCFQVVGIGGVFVTPRERGRGHVRRLLEPLLETASDDGPRPGDAVLPDGADGAVRETGVRSRSRRRCARASRPGPSRCRMRAMWRALRRRGGVARRARGGAWTAVLSIRPRAGSLPRIARLGSTDLDVFPLCLGGNVFGWTIDEERSFAVLDAYFQAGGNFIDTADSYGRRGPGGAGESERIIGRWMASRGNREELVIATKVGMSAGAPGPLGGDDQARHRGLARAAGHRAVSTSTTPTGTTPTRRWRRRSARSAS